MNLLAYMIERSARYYKNNTALISEGELMTFEQVHKISNTLSNTFQKLGVTKGERVGILLPNSSPYCIADFALIKSGLVRVPLNTRLTTNEIEYILNDSNASILIYGNDYAMKVSEIRDNIPFVKHFICVGNENTSDLSYEKLLTQNSPENDYVDTNEEDLFQILYTSGTTGKPKGAVTDVRSRISSLNNVFIDELMIKPTDAMIHVASLAHGGGTKVLPHFVKGAANILMPKFQVDEFFNLVEKYGATTTWMVPTMISMLVQFENLHEYDYSSLNTIIYAGAPMPVATLKRAIDVFGNIFVQVYGLSEAPNPDLVLTKNDHITGLYEKPRILASAGREIMNARVLLIDKDGNEVPTGEIGEVIISGDNIMKEYWGLREATKETIRDGWLYTGDLAKKDEDGYIYIVDRRKDMIISGGYNIYPREIEEVLYQHQSVLEATVFGIPDNKWGESVKACVALRQGETVTAVELIEYCRKFLASYKKPKSIDFLDELPKSSNGKILKRELRSQYWQSCDRQV
ncbi:long-chain-fatty-acid--CoA ligase [Neobacillus novalis]|uniref:Long-chain-fatty-acid--CoA ligase n=1 Tax=Neobacillus novalis TaxID=220687 RepID=A0AA95MNK5_9BACI|nr:long-chain-fatty-acid--CoA ligase [Neobacillus novalis]WHY83988.1 long-chain-fatty-acid--CoA ligase [Neobacillus novalis]